MSGFNMDRTRKLLQYFDFENLFIEELGWNRYREQLLIEVVNISFKLEAVAEKRGLVVFLCSPPPTTDFPPYALRRKIERQAAKVRHEHLIIYIDPARTRQVWQWVKREPGRPDACREHNFHKGQSGDSLLQKIAKLVVTLDEEESISIVDMVGRTRAAFNVEKITKKFYELFKKEHSAFLAFVEGITGLGDRQWYASIMLNRLMFVYFIQKKGFLDNDLDYLRNRLQMMQQEKGKGRFYSFYRHFLLRLFHEGLGKKKEERNPELDRMLGKIPYLNGGLFDVHELEQEYSDIQINDDAFERLFAFFEQYHWHLDERPLRQDNEINPDVLGYIFEKYINQKQMGAYYTKEDITEYISKNTIIPYLFDAALKKCKIAFEGEQSVWNLLQKDPDRYIYEAVRKGCELDLPHEIAVGLDDDSPGLLERRKEWNKPAPEEYALPTEIWREVVARHKQYGKIKARLVAGGVRSINDFITCNLNIRQFAQDVIENCEGPELLRAFWHAIVGSIPRKSNEKTENGITILDPTCGSGAFLFAALNILEPLYEACLDRMQSFIAELEQSDDKIRPEKFGDFRAELERVKAHPNQGYFIMKSIILNNLYGVDIMAEAVEICKLRLFLKLIAQVEKGDQIEPLPDIDFNIRCGNTLVGFATYGEVREALSTSKGAALLPGMDAGRMAKIEQKAQDLQQAFDIFRRRQVEGDGSVPHEDKLRVRERLAVLEDELNRALAGKYGVNPEKDKKTYEKWNEYHQPFHWFVEYYGIMSRGGFDVIIGNPPYIVYTKSKVKYTINPVCYKTFPTKNLYSYVFERSCYLGNHSCSIGLIVQLTVLSSEKLESLQKLLFTRGILYSLPFPRRPESMFDGVEMPVAILLSCPSETREYVTSNVGRIYKEERPFALMSTHFVEHKICKDEHRIAKIGSSLERNIISKFDSYKMTVDHLTQRSSQYFIYYQEACRYWLKACVGQPFFMKNGIVMMPPHGRILYLNSSEAEKFTNCLLNSSFFYWYYSVFSDCEHVNDKLVKKMPIPSSWMNTSWDELSKLLEESLRCNANRKVINTKEGHKIEYDEIKASLSKEIINQIDFALAGIYSLTKEELDFIINYDIKYRMGLGSVLVDDDSYS